MANFVIILIISVFVISIAHLANKLLFSKDESRMSILMNMTQWRNIAGYHGYSLEDDCEMFAFLNNNKVYYVKPDHALKILRKMMHNEKFDYLLRRYSHVEKSLPRIYKISHLDGYYYIKLTDNEKLFWLQTQYGADITKYLNNWISHRQLLKFGKIVI